MIIDENDLDFDGDVRLYHGQPFTGTARAFHSNGAIAAEYPFSNGFEEGVCREWHCNGLLKREWWAIRGVADGKVCEWHKNGQVKSILFGSNGIELTFDEWSDAGLLIMHREIDRQSELWKFANRQGGTGRK